MAKRSMTSEAYNKIKKAVLFGKLKPGYRVSVSQLAGQFGMSRTPIREAIQILAHEDLIELQKGTGFYAKSVTFCELREITEVRVALECLAMRTTVLHAPKAQITSLISRWKDARQRFLDGTVTSADEFLALDRETHYLILHNCKNDYLIGLFEDIFLRVARFQTISLNEESAVDAAEQHIDILEAILEKDVTLAVKRLEEHIQFSFRYIAKRCDDHMDGELIGASYLDDVFS